MEKKYKAFYQGSLYGHFGRDRSEPEYEPDWCMVFYKKPKDDIEFELI